MPILAAQIPIKCKVYPLNNEHPKQHVCIVSTSSQIGTINLYHIKAAKCYYSHELHTITTHKTIAS